MKTLTLVSLCLIFFCLPALTQQPDGHVRSVTPFHFVQEENHFSLTVHVAQGDWLQSSLSCPSGPYIDSRVFPDCGQPEFWAGSEYIEITCWDSPVPDPSTTKFFENFCGTVMKTSGMVTVQFPVLKYGVNYRGSVIVLQGAGRE